MPSQQVKVTEVPRIARLELTWTPNGEGRWTCNYDLVLPLGEVDCRGTFDQKPAKKRPKSHRMVWLDADNCKRIPLGRTESTGGRATRVWPDGNIDTPFRDGAHMAWDAEKLGLRKFVISGDEIRELITTAEPVGVAAWAPV